jgi:hypothetical protein
MYVSGYNKFSVLVFYQCVESVNWKVIRTQPDDYGWEVEGQLF